ncbi:MAG: hypothetical protein HGA67_02340 [Candidatus Yonathbacteria bacterium]|nr:hypothetical protein [Candidatus Yonathbacteria bacterium]
MSFNEFGNLRESIIKVRQETEQNLEKEKEEDWPIQDSGLLSGEEHSYNSTFENLYPPEFSDLRDYIETKLSDRRGNAIGIDIGGIGSKLFTEFSFNFFKKSAGITLVDKRNPQEINRDSEIRHKVLEADIFSNQGRNKLKHWLGEDNIDVIFEKMHGALLNYPDDPTFLITIFNRWYKLLGDKGLMFIQTPSLREDTLELARKFLDEIKNGKIGGITVNYEVKAPNKFGSRIHLVLEKNINAPESLIQERSTLKD